VRTVGQERDASRDGLDDGLPGHEDHARQQPGQVGAARAGRLPAADDLHDPDDEDGAHGDHDRFPAQCAVGQQQARQYGPAGPDGQQPADQADGGERLGRVPGQAGQQAKVGGEEQPGQCVPAALLREHPAQIAQGPDGDDVDHYEHDRNQEMLPDGGQPGQPGITDPHEPVGLVEPDPVGRAGEVDRIERQPVIELAVVAIGRRQGYVRRQLGRSREMPSDEDEPADVALSP
jgi:hypothetical protein